MDWLPHQAGRTVLMLAPLLALVLFALVAGLARRKRAGWAVILAVLGATAGLSFGAWALLAGRHSCFETRNWFGRSGIRHREAPKPPLPRILLPMEDAGREIAEALADSAEAAALGVDEAAEAIRLQSELLVAPGGESSIVVLGRRKPRAWIGCDSKHGGLIGTLLLGLAVAAFLYVGYIFLDASTRGQFTWALRLLSVVAFACILVAMLVLCRGM